MSEEKNQQNSIMFIDSSISLNEITNVITKNPEISIFSFDYSSHKLLEKQQIRHQISDDFLTEDDLDLIQKSSYDFTEWYKNSKIRQFQNYEQIDLGSLYKIEFFVFLLPFLKIFFEIKNIVSLNPKSNLHASNQLYEISKSFEKNLGKIYGNPSNQSNFFYDTLQFENNLFSIELSQKSIKKIKNVANRFLDIFYKNVNNFPKLLLVEFNTILYKELFDQLGSKNISTAFFGLRRLPIWNLKSFKIFNNSKCKIAYLNREKNVLDSKLPKQIEIANENFEKLLKNHNDILHDFFKLKDFSFWDVLKPYFIKIFEKHLLESIESIEISKYTLTNLNPKHVMLLSESGKTEQITLQLSKQLGINTILLQHGLGHDNPKGHLYNHFTGSIVDDSDYFFVWGDAMYRYAKKYGLSLGKILKIGSIVHDQTFKIKKKVNENYILVAPQGPLHMHVKDYTVKANDEYRHIIRTLCKIAKKNNKSLIIKLHPYEEDNNEPEIANEIDSDIRVVKSGEILPLISSCNFMISIGTSISNVILDGHILKKPVLRIPFGEWMDKPDQLREPSCYNVQLEEFDSVSQKLFSNSRFRTEIIQKGQKFVDDCLENKGNVSKEIIKFLEEN